LLLKGRMGSTMSQRAEHYRGYNIDGNVQGRGWSVGSSGIERASAEATRV
jgi:hypothetical protein